MGFIYSASVLTHNGVEGFKVGKAARHRIGKRLAEHDRDIQWQSFDVYKVWEVEDEDWAESELLAELKNHGSPIHGRETFSHGISPQRIANEVMSRLAIREVVSGDYVGPVCEQTWFEKYLTWVKRNIANFDCGDRRTRDARDLAKLKMVVHAAALILAPFIGALEIFIKLGLEAIKAHKAYCVKRSQERHAAVLDRFAARQA